MSGSDCERVVPLSELGERWSGLRLRERAALETMRRSVLRHGQLEPVVALCVDGLVEILDGFKRLHVARQLGWEGLRVRTSDVSIAEAKAQIVSRHNRSRLTELEEGWVVRSLYRDDGLNQPEIGRLLDRHKSWVCRRLLLVEALDPAVQANVRLGLLAPRAAVALSQLPRGNQPAASAVVTARGLTVRQAELFVMEILEQPDEAARAAWIARRLDARCVDRPRPPRPVRSEVDWIAADIATVRRVAARLEARLLATPLGAVGGPATEIIIDALVLLDPVLVALSHTVRKVTGRERAA